MNEQGFTQTQLNALAQVMKQAVPPIVEEIVDKKLKPIIKKLNKMDKKLDVVIDHFDHRVIDVDKRLVKVEKHRGFETSPLV